MKNNTPNRLDEVRIMREELEAIKSFLEKGEIPGYVLSLYNIAAKSVELALNVLLENDQYRQ